MYEQGIAPDLERTPLAEGASLGIHESQSRFVENQIGQSRAFWERYAPKAREAFPDALADARADDLYRAVNRVEPSLIRVEADEVTYNLHVMLRFELERGLVQGTISVGELPELWRAKMDEYLGVVPETDADGVLQDVHWSLGAIGYFPTYALGTLMSAQIAEAMEADLGDLDGRVSRGEFEPILDWLRTNIHRHGRKFTAPRLLERVTGDAFSADAWLEYVRSKYGALYGLT
jgi:carboxypeptidase Taq